jgi:hypothetical protein
VVPQVLHIQADILMRCESGPDADVEKNMPQHSVTGIPVVPLGHLIGALPVL